MILRPATLDDAKILFAWRNDPETRNQSRNANEVAWDEHVAWLTQSFSWDGFKMYIAEDQGVPIGTVRSYENEEGFVELSWTIAPSARGKGYGKRMVLEFVRQFHPEDKLTATVRKGNIPSAKIAQALGLQRLENSEDSPFAIWR